MEDRLAKLEAVLSAFETERAVNAEKQKRLEARFSQIDARLDRIDALISRLAWLIIAAIIEGFGRQLINSATVRYSIAFATFLLWLAYFYLPRREEKI